MKKLISCFMMLSLLFTGANFCSRVAFAEDSSSGWEIKHKKYVVTSSGVDCVSDICVSEAVPSGVNSSGKELYRKKVEIKNDFFLPSNDDCISVNSLCFYFDYNDEGVFFEDKEIMKDETHSFNKRWKTTSSEEIYKATEQCIVSQRIGIYNKDTSLKNLADTDEVHIDIICTNNGEVSFSVKDVKTPLNDGKNVPETVIKSETSVKIEKLKKELIKETSEKDEGRKKGAEGTKFFEKILLILKTIGYIIIRMLVNLI